MKWGNINELCDVVRETSFAIHKYHRNGHLEKTYENALVNWLRKLGLKVGQQFPLTVYDEDGTVLGEYYVGVWAGDELVPCMALSCGRGKRASAPDSQPLTVQSATAAISDGSIERDDVKFATRFRGRSDSDRLANGEQDDSENKDVFTGLADDVLAAW